MAVMANPTIPIVIALIKNDAGQILIARRHDPDTPEAHNKWELVGGKIEYDETPEQAVVREAKEETGLDIEVVTLLPKAFVNYWKKKDGSETKVVLLTYECRIAGGELHRTRFDSKISELKFIALSDIGNYEYVGPVNEMVLLPYAEDKLNLK